MLSRWHSSFLTEEKHAQHADVGAGTEFITLAICSKAIRYTRCNELLLLLFFFSLCFHRSLISLWWPDVEQHWPDSLQLLLKGMPSNSFANICCCDVTCENTFARQEQSSQEGSSLFGRSLPKQPRTSVGRPNYSRTSKAQFRRPLYVHVWTYIFGRTVGIQKRMYKSEWHPPTAVKTCYRASNNGVN